MFLKKKEEIIGIFAVEPFMNAVFYEKIGIDGKEGLSLEPIRIILVKQEPEKDLNLDNIDRHVKFSPLMVDRLFGFTEPDDYDSFLGYAPKGKLGVLQDWTDEIEEVKKRHKVK